MKFENMCKIRDAYRQRDQLKEKIYEFECMRLSPRGNAYGKERVQSSTRGDIQPDTLAKLETLLEEYNAKLAKVVDLITEFEYALETLNYREQQILRLYYIDRLTWEQVCVEMNLSWTPMHNSRKAAIQKICPDYQPNEKNGEIKKLV
jgi:DNA-directed RNA polymerase specialized sigma subunit